jgi:Na+-translocating ferredoxin:NAD+ oxidoreductase RNF subunit RnfB
VVSGEQMRRVADVFAQEGADAWFVRSVEELLGPQVCKECGGKGCKSCKPAAKKGGKKAC